MSGLSLRTIQRIEKGHNANLESLKSFAAVFEVFTVVIAVLILIAALLKPGVNQKLVGVCISLATTFCAYIWAVLVRLSDRYSIWQTDT